MVEFADSTEFLNDIVKQLWPNINVAGGKMVKDIVEPMFKTMLPGPLASLHFTKIDLGPVPLRLSNAKTTKTEQDGIKLRMNLDWASKSDIEMDADMMPALVSPLSSVSRRNTDPIPPCRASKASSLMAGSRYCSVL
jgi:Ca2+-dependent lipid-binding protein